MDRRIDPKLVERFWADLQDVWHQHSDPLATLGVAVSGGPDSLALLLLAHAAMPGKVAAATVDHGLRAASVSEASFVADICAELGIPHTTLAVTVGDGNLQGKAREARYRALLDWLPRQGDGHIFGTGWGPSALATAHHADDQAETLLMRLNRGSGLSGLAGIRANTLFGSGTAPVIRPLLGWRRAELARIVNHAGITPVDDPSNRNPEFDRARIRQALASANWIDVSGFARSAAHLQQLETTLDFVIEEEFEACTEQGEPWIYYPFDRGQVHRQPIWMGVLVVMAMQMDFSLSADQAARMVESLLRGEKINIARMQAWTVKDGERVAWYLGPEPPRRTS